MVTDKTALSKKLNFFIHLATRFHMRNIFVKLSRFVFRKTGDFIGQLQVGLGKNEIKVCVKLYAKTFVDIIFELRAKRVG